MRRRESVHRSASNGPPKSASRVVRGRECPIRNLRRHERTGGDTPDNDQRLPSDQALRVCRQHTHEHVGFGCVASSCSSVRDNWVRSMQPPISKPSYYVTRERALKNDVALVRAELTADASNFEFFTSAASTVTRPRPTSRSSVSLRARQGTSMRRLTLQRPRLERVAPAPRPPRRDALSPQPCRCMPQGVALGEWLISPLGSVGCAA